MRRRTSPCLCAALPLLLAAACALPGAVSAQTPPAAAAEAPSELYLEVSLNDAATGLIARFRVDARGRLCIGSDSLRELGLDPALLGAADAGESALDELPGLRYHYDPARQHIALILDDALRGPYRLSARQASRPPPASASRGMVLNYDAVLQADGKRSLLMGNELRYFDAHGVLSSTGLLSASGQGQRYLRFDTSWSSSDPDTLRTLQVGDVQTSSLSWTRALRLGGIQWRKNFALRPDLLTFPVASLDGSALVPSSLSLFVNGVRQLSTTVPRGPFVVGQVAGINGAGEATLVTRDALGRDSVTTLPLYVDTRLLAPGLNDYALELGWLRRGFGSSSFDYVGQPVLSASGRRGLTPRITLEAHAELGRGMANAGSSALLGLGQAGVASVMLAASAGSGTRGSQWGLGYQYLGRRFALDAQRTRAGAGYGDLATLDGSAAARRQDRLALNVSLGAGQSLGAAYVAYQVPGLAAAAEGRARIASFSYGTSIGRSVFFSLSAHQDLDVRARRGLFASVSMAFGKRTSASIGAGRQEGQRMQQLSVQHSPDIGGGLGWSLQSGSGQGATLRQARVQYLGAYGQAGASYLSAGPSRNLALEAAGALVSTGGVAGVPVLHENRRIGVTGRSGHLLIPNLNAYAANQIGIDVSALAADARVENTALTVVPRPLSGVLARFPVERYRAATIILQDEAGTLLAPGLPVRHLPSGGESLVGYDGVTFIDQLAPLNTLEVGEGPARCSVQFPYQAAAPGVLPVIGPLACRRVMAQ